MNVTASSMQQNSLGPITQSAAAQQSQGKYPYGTFSSQQQCNNSNRFGANYNSNLNTSSGVNNYTSNNNIGSNLISFSPKNIGSSITSNTSGNNGNQAVYSDYSNSNRNLITQKFVPLGENTNNSSPALLSNCHNNSQSFGASSGRANNNITNTNSHLNSTVGSSFSPVSVGSIPSQTSHRTNGTYGTEASSAAAAANGVPHKISPIISNAGCYQIKNSSAGDLKLQPKLSSSDKRSSGDNDEVSSAWNDSCIYKNTGSTLESLNLSARGSNYGNGNGNGNSNNWGQGGLTRDEMKDQLAHSLATDKQINILPGFKRSGESSSSSWLPSYSPSTPSINYGRQQELGSTKDKTNNNRLSSPISRAQHAIGQSRKELGQVRSMMEMSNNGRNIRDSYNNVGGGGSFSARLPKVRNLLTMDTETFLTKKAKQQSYRVDLERQIEQSKIRKDELRRLDLEGDHPLGVKYNSTTPHNYLDDCIKSPRMVNVHAQNPSDKIAKDYAKYLDFMSKRETLSEEKPRQYQQPYPNQQKSTPNLVEQCHASPRNIHQSQQDQNLMSPAPKPYLQQPKPNIMPHPHQQFQQQPYQHPTQSYFPVAQPPYYYQPPYPYYPHPMQAPQASYGQALQIPVPLQQPTLNPFQGHQGLPNLSGQTQRQVPINQSQMTQQRIPIPTESRPSVPKSHSEVRDSINKNKIVHQPKHNDSFDFLTEEEEEESNTEELEQSLRLHVWQESDQMPDPELKTNLYKRDLMKQIFQKKKEQMARKAKEIAEDEKIEMKILEYQRKMKKEVEEERSQLNLMNQIRQKKGHHHHHHQHDTQFRLRGQPQYLHSRHHCQRYTKEENLDEYSQSTNNNVNSDPRADGDRSEIEADEFHNSNNHRTPIESYSDESIVSGCSSDDFVSPSTVSSHQKPKILPSIILPTLVHNNNAANRVETAAAKQGKIVDDLQLLTNVHKILKMEAKRVLKEKKLDKSLS